MFINFSNADNNSVINAATTMMKIRDNSKDDCKQSAKIDSIANNKEVEISLEVDTKKSEYLHNYRVCFARSRNT